MTQSALAQAIGVSRRVIGQMETGDDYLTVSVYWLRRLAYVFSCTPADLLEGVTSLSAPDDTIKVKFQLCSDHCLVYETLGRIKKYPLSGSELRDLVNHLNDNHDITRRAFAQLIGVRPNTLKVYFYRDSLMPATQRRIILLLNKWLLSPTLRQDCPSCKVPTTGKQFKNLVFHLQLEHSISEKSLLRALKIKKGTLSEYMYRERLPSSFSNKIRMFLQDA